MLNANTHNIQIPTSVKSTKDAADVAALTNRTAEGYALLLRNPDITYGLFRGHLAVSLQVM